MKIFLGHERFRSPSLARRGLVVNRCQVIVWYCTYPFTREGDLSRPPLHSLSTSLALPVEGGRPPCCYRTLGCALTLTVWLYHAMVNRKIQSSGVPSGLVGWNSGRRRIPTPCLLASRSPIGPSDSRAPHSWPSRCWIGFAIGVFQTKK